MRVSLVAPRRVMASTAAVGGDVVPLVTVRPLSSTSSLAVYSFILGRDVVSRGRP